MKRLIVIAGIVLLQGCAVVNTVVGWVPSFSDPNQSARIVDVQLAVDRIDCSGDQLAQASRIRDDLRWFELYSKSKSAVRQQDVLRLIEPIQATTEDWYKRSLSAQGSKGYCEIKKRILITQTDRAARAILGRF